jgi:DNA-binding transcriptional ArsR family regulator
MEIKQAVAALTALAQESRLKVFRLLVTAAEDGIAAGEIGEKLEIPGATLTFHLKELAHAGLVEARREGRSIKYSLRVQGMRELLTFLTKDCCKGRPDLCGTEVELCCPGPVKRKSKKARSVRTRA